MAYKLRMMVLTFLTMMLLTIGASAETLKIGLYYGDTALYSANLQNYQGSGYQVGYYNEDTREFFAVGEIEEEKISMTVDGTIYISGGTYYSKEPSHMDQKIGGYHLALDACFATFDEAQYAASQMEGGFVAYVNDSYRVWVGSYQTADEAGLSVEDSIIWYDMLGTEYASTGTIVAPSETGIVVTKTTTDTILFYFDCGGSRHLSILPQNGEDKAITWFKGYKWYGCFQYRRSGNRLSVINVVDLEDYVKGVLPYEMSNSWPLEALKAQAVCARTYALSHLKKHNKTYGFDLCNTTDCQVYRGTNQSSDLTDNAVDQTAGMVLTYNGKLAETYYYSSNGGATESSANVWNYAIPYLVGKEDPYESTITIPSYQYSTTYTFHQLSQILEAKGYNFGTVCDVYVSRYSATGNVEEITFLNTADRKLIFTGERCKTIFYTTMFGATKSVKSMRFEIIGGSGGVKSYYINDTNHTLKGLSNGYLISGSGTVTKVTAGNSWVITSSGTSQLQEMANNSTASNQITITGTGSGHNVGMSQWGAKAMALLGYRYQDILDFYYTGTTLQVR